jgi:hypothetical protein
MRLLTMTADSPLIRIGPAPASRPGGFATVQQRDRKVMHPAWTEFGSAFTGANYAVSGDPIRQLTTDQLFQVYRRTPDVRSAVDSITRRVATTDWVVQPVEGAFNSEDRKALDEAMIACREATRWFRAPMKGKTWQQFLTMVVQDLLIYDATAWEKVKAGKKLDELNVSRGDDWWPVIDPHGLGTSMEQRVNGKAQSFPMEDVVYLNLFPNTTTPRGMPLIETVVNEVIAILRAAERAMLTMDASEIPPGILYLTGIAGKAAEDTVQSFVSDKGRDHKMRVLHFPNPAAGSAEWIRLDHSPKELGMIEVVEQVRRTIWRIFGVFPVEMGATDGMPRATAEVQMDAAASHLLTPILELLQEVITTQVLPLVVDEKWLGLVEFSFDYSRDLTPAEEKTLAEKDKVLVDTGILSRNEVRTSRGYDPVDDGDVITVSGTATTLAQIVDPPPPPPPPTPPGAEPKDGEGEDPKKDPPDGEDPEGGDAAPGETDGKGDGAADGEAAPGEAEAEAKKGITRLPAHRHDRACFHEGEARGLPDPDSLPSDWQPAGRFRGKRVVDLSELGGVVSRYQSTVLPLWEEAMTGFQAKLRAAYGDSKITPQESAALAGDLAHALHRLSTSWDVETEPLYRDAANLGDLAAEKFTGGKGSTSASERGDRYASLAMAYLTGTDGPLENVRHRILAILGAVSRSRTLGARAATTVPDGVAPGMELEALLAATAHAWSRNEHRIANWGGKLVELANEAMRDGMTEVNLDKKTGERADWMVEWVNVGDDHVCRTCTDLGTRGFVDLRTLPTIPGGNTECGARDRCVLVYWTKGEVADGSAALLGGGNTGKPL